jgi:hypothetical protein
MAKLRSPIPGAAQGHSLCSKLDGSLQREEQFAGDRLHVTPDKNSKMLAQANTDTRALVQ